MAINPKALVSELGNVPAFATLRFKAGTERPYYSSILFTLIPIENEKVSTLGVDKWWRLNYNPKMLAEVTIEEAVGLLIHEINHLIRDHHDRQGDRDHTIWNIAGDLSINPDILKDGLALPEFGCFPGKGEFSKLKEGLAAEQYYDELMKNAVKIKMTFSSGSKGKGAGTGNCGSCAGDGEKDWEDKNGGGGGEGKDKDGKGKDANGMGTTEGVDKLTQELAKRNFARELLEHSKTQGNVPDSLVRWAKDKLKSKVNWKKELRSSITNVVNYVSGMVDYTRSRLSRRQSAFGDVMMYGFHSPVPRIGVIIDTSGSMGDKDLGQAVAEVGSVLKATRAEIVVVACDAAAGQAQKVSSSSQVKLTGGGGTDMPEGFRAVNELKPKPDIVICITDGLTPWPHEPYKFKALAVITRKGSEKNVPKWIKVLPAYQDDSD